MTKKAKKLILGDRVRLARIRAGMTQHHLGLETMIAQSHISEVETGNRSLKAEQLFSIAIATKRSLKFFTSGGSI